ncbi:MAG: dihydrolipoamide acetyltransferase family protein [Acidobacteriota bacterium]
MKVDLVMPQMGESIAEGTIAKWLKKAGDKVERDESVLEISTDKVDTEVPSPGTGVISKILVEEGETVEVGTVLAEIESDAEQAQPEKRAAQKPAEKPTEAPLAEKPKPEAPPQAKEAPRQEPRISPVARNLADKEGLSPDEVSEIQGSGSEGRLTKDDVLRYLERREAPHPEQPRPEAAAPAGEQVPAMKFPYDRDRVEIIPMSTMRRKIAEHMVYSKRTSPHVYTVAEVDMTRIVQFREQVKSHFEKKEGFKLTYTPFVLHATVRALRQWPIVNSSVEGEKIIRKMYINLGVAVAIEDGLIVPVIRDADEKSLLGLARELYDLGTRAREKKLKPHEVQDGTFTVTNPGVFGSIFGLPVINQPQLGILGVGAVKKRPVVIDDAIAIRSIMLLTLSYDHRIIDGALAGRFLQQIVTNLEEGCSDEELTW